MHRAATHIGSNNLLRKAATGPGRTLGVLLLLPLLSLPAIFDSGVALAEIPVRVFHSPGDDGNFNFELRWRFGLSAAASTI